MAPNARERPPRRRAPIISALGWLAFQIAIVMGFIYEAPADLKQGAAVYGLFAAFLMTGLLCVAVDRWRAFRTGLVSQRNYPANQSRSLSATGREIDQPGKFPPRRRIGKQIR